MDDRNELRSPSPNGRGTNYQSAATAALRAGGRDRIGRISPSFTSSGDRQHEPVIRSGACEAETDRTVDRKLKSAGGIKTMLPGKYTSCRTVEGASVLEALSGSKAGRGDADLPTAEGYGVDAAKQRPVPKALLPKDARRAIQQQQQQQQQKQQQQATSGLPGNGLLSPALQPRRSSFAGYLSNSHLTGTSSLSSSSSSASVLSPDARSSSSDVVVRSSIGGMSLTTHHPEVVNRRRDSDSVGKRFVVYEPNAGTLMLRQLRADREAAANAGGDEAVDKSVPDNGDADEEVFAARPVDGVVKRRSELTVAAGSNRRSSFADSRSFFATAAATEEAGRREKVLPPRPSFMPKPTNFLRFNFLDAAGMDQIRNKTRRSPTPTADEFRESAPNRNNEDVVSTRPVQRDFRTGRDGKSSGVETAEHTHPRWNGEDVIVMPRQDNGFSKRSSDGGSSSKISSTTSPAVANDDASPGGVVVQLTDAADDVPQSVECETAEDSTEGDVSRNSPALAAEDTDAALNYFESSMRDDEEGDVRITESSESSGGNAEYALFGTMLNSTELKIDNRALTTEQWSSSSPAPHRSSSTLPEIDDSVGDVLDVSCISINPPIITTTAGTTATTFVEPPDTMQTTSPAIRVVDNDRDDDQEPPPPPLPVSLPPPDARTDDVVENDPDDDGDRLTEPGTRQVSDAGGLAGWYWRTAAGTHHYHRATDSTATVDSGHGSVMSGHEDNGSMTSSADDDEIQSAVVVVTTSVSPTRSRSPLIMTTATPDSVTSPTTSDVMTTDCELEERSFHVFGTSSANRDASVPLGTGDDVTNLPVPGAIVIPPSGIRLVDQLLAEHGTTIDELEQRATDADGDARRSAETPCSSENGPTGSPNCANTRDDNRAKALRNASTTQADEVADGGTGTTSSSLMTGTRGPIPKSPTGEKCFVDVTITKGSIGLGFCIEGGIGSASGDRPICVKRLFRSGENSGLGDLRAGDEILSVNGDDYTILSHYEAWNRLKALPDGNFVLSIRR